MQALQPPFLSLPDSQQRWVNETLARMTLREKIGQLFMIAVTSNFTNAGESLASQQGTISYKMDKAYVASLIKAYHVGGVIILRKNEPKAFVDLLNYYQNLSQIPLLVGLDAEWGLSLRVRNMIRFPRALTLGAIQDASLIEQMGELVGKQCRAAGVHWNFVPDVDVNNNPRNPVIHDRSFGDDPQHVADYAIRYMKGLRAGGVLTCAKHFPGHGDTAVDSHSDLPVIGHTRDHLDAIELYPFKKILQAGVDGVMGAHLSVPVLGVPVGQAASLSPSAMTDLLQKELQFSGLVVTDALGMGAIIDHYQAGEAALQALLAGNDVILCPVDVPVAVALIERALQDGCLSEAELDRRVLKILKAKAWVGLDHYTPASYDEFMKLCSDVQARQLKQQLYAQAVTAVNGAEKKLPFVGATHVVIPVLGMNKYAQQNFGVSAEVIRRVAELRAQGKQVMVVLFGTPYSVALFPKDLPILVAYEDDPDAQQAVAEILLGQRHVAGQLAIRLEPNCLVTPAAR